MLLLIGLTVEDSSGERFSPSSEGTRQATGIQMVISDDDSVNLQLKYAPKLALKRLDRLNRIQALRDMQTLNIFFVIKIKIFRFLCYEICRCIRLHNEKKALTLLKLGLISD